MLKFIDGTFKLPTYLEPYVKNNPDKNLTDLSDLNISVLDFPNEILKNFILSNKFPINISSKNLENLDKIAHKYGMTGIINYKKNIWKTLKYTREGCVNNEHHYYFEGTFNNVLSLDFCDFIDNPLDFNKHAIYDEDLSDQYINCSVKKIKYYVKQFQKKYKEYKENKDNLNNIAYWKELNAMEKACYIYSWNECSTREHTTFEEYIKEKELYEVPALPFLGMLRFRNIEYTGDLIVGNDYYDDTLTIHGPPFLF
ncbi:hypothetical protein crov233 [Cafeteria roenbergensis virus]|uniref:Uncharacterized protein n=1 Tax=Cafeteria roenbergensis virus (strain BV-PW1) TaxID=693272 RepID=E3T503_CROVB|nr:hypothetical protein crov233 [Cafeteria roenbergensis virus BV-PW1]ADO67266.1 hypothetical protein crov233 [Cafeteria roenbergensis virus BV-PW1]